MCTPMKFIDDKILYEFAETNISYFEGDSGITCWYFFKKTCLPYVFWNAYNLVSTFFLNNPISIFVYVICQENWNLDEKRGANVVFWQIQLAFDTTWYEVSSVRYYTWSRNNKTTKLRYWKVTTTEYQSDYTFYNLKILLKSQTTIWKLKITFCCVPHCLDNIHIACIIPCLDYDSEVKFCTIIFFFFVLYA